MEGRHEQSTGGDDRGHRPVPRVVVAACTPTKPPPPPPGPAPTSTSLLVTVPNLSARILRVAPASRINHRPSVSAQEHWAATRSMSTTLSASRGSTDSGSQSRTRRPTTSSRSPTTKASVTPFSISSSTRMRGSVSVGCESWSGVGLHRGAKALVLVPSDLGGTRSTSADLGPARRTVTSPTSSRS